MDGIASHGCVASLAAIEGSWVASSKVSMAFNPANLSVRSLELMSAVRRGASSWIDRACASTVFPRAEICQHPDVPLAGRHGHAHNKDIGFSPRRSSLLTHDASSALALMRTSSLL